MSTYTINAKTIFKRCTVNASVKDTWHKWTTHDGLLTFFGADNKIALEIGGPFEIFFLMDNPYGLRGSETCTIISYLPEKMLSFTWNAPPNFEYVRNHEHKTHVVILFHSINENTSTLELYHTGWLDGDEFDQVFNYFDAAWQIVLTNFEKSFSNS